MEKKNWLQLAEGAGTNLIMGQAMDLLDGVLDYKELMMGYACAIKEINTKFEVLDTEFEVRYKRNPISSIETRLKSQTSILEKMARMGIPPTRENIENNLNDIAGIRVICSYIDDIYLLADALTKQDDIRLIRRKDYISSPETERLPQPSSDRQCPDLLCGVHERSKGGGTDPDHCHGFLGESGASDQIQEKSGTCGEGDRPSERVRR